MRMREVGCKFVLTDYERAGRIVEVVKGLDFVQEVFLMGEEPMDGCTSFDVLLKDSGEGRLFDAVTACNIPKFYSFKQI